MSMWVCHFYPPPPQKKKKKKKKGCSSWFPAKKQRHQKINFFPLGFLLASPTWASKKAGVPRGASPAASLQDPTASYWRRRYERRRRRDSGWTRRPFASRFCRESVSFKGNGRDAGECSFFLLLFFCCPFGFPNSKKDSPGPRSSPCCFV